MPRDQRLPARPHRGQRPAHLSRADWPGVGPDDCPQVPVPPRPPAERPGAPRRAIEPADSPRLKAVEPGLDEQQDDWLAQEQRGSWRDCGSLPGLPPVVPRRPHGLRLRPRGPRLRHHHVRLRVQKRLLPRGTRQWTNQREELWVFSRCHLFYSL